MKTKPQYIQIRQPNTLAVNLPNATFHYLGLGPAIKTNKVSEFYSRGRLSKQINASFITIIPKITAAKCIKDYHPISLIGSIDKIHGKCLQVDSKRYFHYFNGSRGLCHESWILDEVPVANECVHSRHKERRLGLLCKQDLEKAYGRVD